LFNATKSEQENLLKLATLDVKLSQAKTRLQALEKSDRIEKLRKDLLETSENLLNSHAARDRIATEVKKIEADVELVSRRIAQDAEKAKQVTSDRELKAVENELASLKHRISDLEDQELDCLEQIAKAESEVEALTQLRAKLNLELEGELATVHNSSLTISTEIKELENEKTNISKNIDQLLLDAYVRKSARGLAVAQTLGRDCSACRLAINGTEFEAIMGLPEESLPTCPNCDAFIIR
jgi:predicted  nucleic acid-binding Zn-ribbon protein